MARLMIAALSILFLVAIPCSEAACPNVPGPDARAQDESYETVLSELAVSKDMAGEPAYRALLQKGPSAIEQLIRIMSDESRDEAKAADVVLERLVHDFSGAKDESLRVEATNALLDALDAPYATKLKRRLLRLVALSASDENVPALMKRIVDPELGDRVIWALSRVPDALDELEEALPDAKPEKKVNLIQAVARFKNPASYRAIAPFMEDPDEAVRHACLHALADIIAPDAIELLLVAASRNPGKAGLPWWCRLAEVGDRLYGLGKKSEAMRVYGHLHADCPWTSVQCTGLRGMALIDPEAAMPRLREAVFNGPSDLAGAAVDALIEIPEDAGLDLLLEILKSGRAPIKVHVIHAMVRIKHSPSRTGRIQEALFEAIKTEKMEVKLSAIHVLSLAEEGEANEIVPLLVDQLPSSEQPVREGAFLALSRIDVPETGEVLLSRLDELLDAECLEPETDPTSSELAAKLIDLLGIRHEVKAFDAMVKALASSDDAVRISAVHGLGRLNLEGAAPVLFGHGLAAEQGECEAVEKALYRLDDPKATAALVELQKGAPDAARVRVISALGERGDASLAPVYLAAVDTHAVDVAVAALDALGKLEDPAHIPVLLKAMEHGWPEEKKAGHHAYLRIARALEAEDRGNAREMYTKALALAETDELKTVAIQRLGALGDMAIIDTVRPYLGKGNDRLRKAAATALAPAALKMADASAEEERRAIPILREVVQHSEEIDAVARASVRLRKAGEKVKVPVRKGYMDEFHVIGPFSGRDALMKTDLIDPARPVDLARTVTFKDTEFSWKKVPLDHIRGMLDLLEAVADTGDAGAYVYTEIECSEPRTVQFMIGSDDDVYCWLNQSEVHRFEGGRGWVADQDVIEVNLVSGTNIVLMKVLNGGGGWAVSLRIADEDGVPLDLQNL